MRLIIAIIALLVIGAIVGSLAVFVWGRSSVNLAQGELRCESPGAVIINVGGSDYGVNAIGAWTPLKTSEVVTDGPLHCERLGIGPGTNRNQVDQINTPSSPHG
ncbi:MAG: hypothetical protein WA446_04455, partial [Steroidobacteraceae bacterium]